MALQVQSKVSDLSRYKFVKSMQDIESDQKHDQIHTEKNL